MRFLLAALAAAFLALPPEPSSACGPDSDCLLGERHYRLYLPAGHDGATPLGALVFAHGYKGSAKGAMNNGALRGLADELGVALIAGKSAGDDWDLPGAPRNAGSTGAAEFAYYEAVIEDVASRIPLDRNRLVMTGFSAGGMMVWNLACRRSELFAAFLPVAGTFWQPEPESCSSPPAELLHIHGTTDQIVPLGGRPIADTYQGDMARVLEMYRAHGGYQGAESFAMGELSCEAARNAEGRQLSLCLHGGGHSFKIDHLRDAWRHFEALGVL